MIPIDVRSAHRPCLRSLGRVGDKRWKLSGLGILASEGLFGPVLSLDERI